MNSNPRVEGWSNEFNTSSLNEIIVYYDDGDASSEYFQDVNVLLSNGVWTGLKEALGLHLVIPNNYNTHFREPVNEVERDRGWYD